MSVHDLLRACPIFFELYDKEINKIVKQCSVVTYKADENLITDSEEGEEFGILLSGSARVEKQAGAKRIHVQNIRPGDVFGEMVLVGEKKRTADIVASEKCEVLVIPYQGIFNLFKKEPSIFGLMMLNLSRLLIGKMKGTNSLLVDLQNKLANEESRKSA